MKSKDNPSAAERLKDYIDTVFQDDGMAIELRDVINQALSEAERRVPDAIGLPEQQAIMDAKENYYYQRPAPLADQMEVYYLNTKKAGWDDCWEWICDNLKR
jgi:hypothetical protein